MFNFTVLKLKDIIKYSIYVGLIIIFCVCILKIVQSKDLNKQQLKTVEKAENKLGQLTKNSFWNCFESTISTSTDNIQSDNKEKENNAEKNGSKLLKGVLKSQVSVIDFMEADIEEEQQENEDIANNNSEENLNKDIQPTYNNELASEGLATEVITENPLQGSFTDTYNAVKIKNQTSYELTDDILTPDITFDNKNIIIYHTHSCESYTSSDLFPYEPTGTYRTTDLNYTVTRVGAELEDYLKRYNINVVHNCDYHDYPSYNGSYTRSLNTVTNMLQSTPSDIVIDLHRDAVGARNDYAPIVKIGDNDVAAQIMFVIGTNEGGLWHPNWQQNLKYAVKIQQKAEEMYPGLFKPMMVTKSRYNQHVSKYANIIEVGATGNTLEQCLTSMKYLSKVINEVLCEK